MDGLQFETLFEAQARGLERQFEEKEIWDAVHSMNGDKAPVLMVFLLLFSRWGIIKEDILNCFQYFYGCGTFEKSLNSTFIAEVTNVKDFRPISLIGGVYKILAKVLANRLKSVLETVISPIL